MSTNTIFDGSLSPNAGNKKASSISSANLTPEMTQWLADNGESYEFYFLHLLMHDPVQRQEFLTTLVTPDDFVRESYALVVGALIGADKIAHFIGWKVPTPPSASDLKTYLGSAASMEGFEDEIVQEATNLIDELQDPKYAEQHYCVRPYFEAWYSSGRAKKLARKLTMLRVPDVRGFVETIHDVLDTASQIDGNLDDCEFDFEQHPEAPEPILTLGDHVICTPGNISNVQGPPKTAKSAVVGAIIAATLKESCTVADTLGFAAEPPAGRGVLHFDTEQSRHDHHSLVCRAYARARQTTEADWLHSYCLTGMEPVRCWDFLLRKLRKAVDEHSGVMMVIIDGIADFCMDPNDAHECFELVRKLHKLAADYNCVVITVLHENPSHGNSRFAKPRGHLGSQLERKAETMLKLSKDATGISVIWADLARHCFIPKGAGQRLQWCENARMHVSLQEGSETSGNAKPDKKSKYAAEVTTVTDPDETLQTKDLIERMGRKFSHAPSTAKARIAEYVDFGLLEKLSRGNYRVPGNESSA